MSVLNTGLAKSSAADDYTIDNSLRFDDGDSPYMSWTPSSANSVRTKWTISAWVKLGNFGGNRDIFSAGDGAAKEFSLSINSANNLSVYNYTSGVYNLVATTSAVLRDPSAWYHILCRYDSTDVTSDDRVQLFINGERQTLGTNTQPSSSFAADFWSYNGAHFISSYPLSRTNYMDGYLAEVYSIDGTAYTASDFGELSSTTNQWRPIDASGLTFGTNGFYQKYGSIEDADVFADSADRSVHTMTVGGDAHTDTTTKKIGTASAEFDGTGDYLYVDGSNTTVTTSDFVFTGDFTVEGWVYPNSSGSGEAYLIAHWKSGAYSSGWAVQYDHDSNQFASWVNFSTSAGDTETLTQSGTSAENAWYHVAMTRSGNVYTLWLDGVSQATATNAGTLIENSAVYLAIGAGVHTGGNAYNLDGFLDEVRISDTARYTANFTTFGQGGGTISSPTAFTADANTLLLLHMDGANDGTTFTDSSYTGAPRHSITPEGDVTNTRAVRKIGDSSIKFDGSGDYLTIPNSSDWDMGTGDFTVECWARFDAVGDIDTIIERDFGTNARSLYLAKQADNTILACTGSGTGWVSCITSSSTVAADTWYHIAYVRDGSDFELFIAGASVGTDSDAATMYDSSEQLMIGMHRESSSTSDPFKGYMDEIRISNSARYTSAFTPSTTAFTADANTKLLIHSNWTGGLGADSSGNYNTFTPTNLVATDQMIDTPTNNFATLNPIRKSVSAMTISEGNLQWSGVDTAYTNLVGTIPMMSGKWYFEIYNIQVDSGGWVSSKVGVLSVKSQAEIQGETHDAKGTLWYDADGKVWCGNGTGSADSFTYGNTYTDGDIIGIAVNMTDSQVTFYKNNTAQDSGTPFDFSNMTQPYGIDDGTLPWVGGLYSADSQVINFGQDSSFAGNKTAQGNQDGNSKGDFYYTPPTDYLALCTDNLSDPEIALPGSHFQSVLYTGTGVNPHAITGVGFQPDLVWTKARTKGAGNGGNPWVTDAIRGVTKELKTDGTEAEATDLNGVVAFGADGFSVGTGGFNYLDDLFVGWNWKAGGAGVSNGTGSITSTVSANTTAGFSIVSYTGDDASSATIGHGLSVAPELVIIKSRDSTEGWYVGSSEGPMSFTSSDYLTLNTDGGESSSSTIWDDTAPTSTVFTVGTNDAVNNTDDFIAYCFHSIEGYSKVGGYTANNSATDNTFVYTAFEPSWLMVKATDGGAQMWTVWDNARNPSNTANKVLHPDDARAEETTGQDMDFYSNGFKPYNNSGPGGGGSTWTYLYLAFAESPFKYSNAR